MELRNTLLLVFISSVVAIFGLLPMRTKTSPLELQIGIPDLPRYQAPPLNFTANNTKLTQMTNALKEYINTHRRLSDFDAHTANLIVGDIQQYIQKASELEASSRDFDCKTDPKFHNYCQLILDDLGSQNHSNYFSDLFVRQAEEFENCATGVHSLYRQAWALQVLTEQLKHNLAAVLSHHEDMAQMESCTLGDNDTRTRHSELCHRLRVSLELSKVLDSKPWVPDELALIHNYLQDISRIAWKFALDPRVGSNQVAQSRGIYFYCGHYFEARIAGMARFFEEIRRSNAHGSVK